MYDYKTFIEICTTKVRTAKMSGSAKNLLIALGEVKSMLLERINSILLLNKSRPAGEMLDHEISRLQNELDSITAQQETICRKYHMDLNNMSQASDMHKSSEISTCKMSPTPRSNTQDNTNNGAAPLIGAEVIRIEDISEADNYQVDPDVYKKVKKFVIDPLIYSDNFQKYHLKANSMFIYGPPGTGKTSLVKHIAKAGCKRLIYTRGAEIEDKYFGDSPKILQGIFDFAKSGDGILFDDLDPLLQKSNYEATQSILSTFLVNTDGVGREADKRPYCLFIATNNPQLYPANLRRRFELHLYVGPPNKAQRKAFIEGHLKNIPLISSDIDVDSLAGETRNYTCSDLKQAIDQANFMRMNGNETPFMLTNEMIHDAVFQKAPTINDTVLQPYIDYAREQGTTLPEYD